MGKGENIFSGEQFEEMGYWIRGIGMMGSTTGTEKMKENVGSPLPRRSHVKRRGTVGEKPCVMKKFRDERARGTRLPQWTQRGHREQPGTEPS